MKKKKQKQKDNMNELLIEDEIRQLTKHNKNQNKVLQKIIDTFSTDETHNSDYQKPSINKPIMFSTKIINLLKKIFNTKIVML